MASSSVLASASPTPTARAAQSSGGGSSSGVQPWMVGALVVALGALAAIGFATRRGGSTA
jgi:hypothetical protein